MTKDTYRSLVSTLEKWFEENAEMVKFPVKVSVDEGDSGYDLEFPHPDYGKRASFKTTREQWWYGRGWADAKQDRPLLDFSSDSLPSHWTKAMVVEARNAYNNGIHDYEVSTING